MNIAEAEYGQIKQTKRVLIFRRRPRWLTNERSARMTLVNPVSTLVLCPHFHHEIAG